MPHRDWRLRIEDILECIEKIQRYTKGMNFEEFVSDEMAFDAVVRNILIIGEAANHIPSNVREQYPEMPWDEMRGIRNILVHEYFGVSAPILWHTIEHDLPPLVPMLKAILEAE
ncbi:MAG: DUF86 domain-containing protein [Firmicutes bacterium]|nr:DUF86 domain-containing protein [Bacillota bacterium]